jgi:hypothetical protein
LPAQGSNTDPLSHTVFDQQIVSGDPMNGSRFLRQRKTSAGAYRRQNVSPSMGQSQSAAAASTDDTQVNTTEETGPPQNASPSMRQPQSAAAADEIQVNTTQRTPPHQNASPSMGQPQSAAAGTGGNRGTSDSGRGSSTRGMTGSSRAGHAAFRGRGGNNIFNINMGQVKNREK